MNRSFDPPWTAELPVAPTLASALREAVVAMLAAIATLACSMMLAQGAGLAVLAVVLSLSLARSHLDHQLRQRLESALALPVVGVATVAVGLLLLHKPVLGATLFVACMSLSICLRRFGANARRIGSLIALPFVTLLVTPHAATVSSNVLPSWSLPIVVALFALFWVTLMQATARAIGFLPAIQSRQIPFAVPQQSGLRPDASTRMAIQMALTLGFSFAVGYAFFDRHWAWIVLTAFIVLSRNRGRLDVVYRSVQRIAGAALGTGLALLVSLYVPGHGYATAALILVSVFMGVWLRPLNYAWWALFVTIALASLQGFADLPPAQILLQRLLEIVIGAAIGVGTSWWVLPVRSEAVLRRRMADVLRALAETVDPQAPDHAQQHFLFATGQLEQLAPTYRFARHFGLREPAHWIDTIIACRRPALTLITNRHSAPQVRRAIGHARKALLEPGTLSESLESLLHTLVLAASGRVSAPED